MIKEYKVSNELKVIPEKPVQLVQKVIPENKECKEYNELSEIPETMENRHTK